MDELGPVHYVVMYWAVDGASILSASAGLLEGIASGEYFVIFDPQPVEAVQKATIDVVGLGYARLHREYPSDPRSYSTGEALALLRDPRTWSGDSYYELSATDAGTDAWKRLDKLYGGAARKAHEVARKRSEEFRQRHPDFEARRAQYFEDTQLWVETGEGHKPEFPRYPNEPPPYDDDVPRGKWPPTE